jgi:hypothetical protein
MYPNFLRRTQSHRAGQHLSFSKYKENLSQWTGLNGALNIALVELII